MQAVGQALPGICGCVLHPIPPVRVELASAFWARVLMLVLLHASCVPPFLATGISQRLRQAKGKGDFRDELRALVF
jgi:hypothetical protein